MKSLPKAGVAGGCRCSCFLEEKRSCVVKETKTIKQSKLTEQGSILFEKSEVAAVRVREPEQNARSPLYFNQPFGGFGGLWGHAETEGGLVSWISGSQ